MSNTYGTHRGYRFDRFLLDLDRGALLDADGELKLRPKSFELLRYLVEHAGTLVSRDELFEAIWPDTVVTDGVVTQCLIDVRRAIDDHSQQKIRTVPRRGYIFDLPVSAVAADERPDPGSEAASPVSPPAGTRVGPLLGVIAGLVAVAALGLWYLDSRPSPQPATAKLADARTSIAVLPFSVMTDETSDTYFADGVSEEILNLLARQQNLRVIARSSSFAFRDGSTDIAEIAERLSVDYVLDGSIRKEQDDVRISVQLIATATREYVWTETFDLTLDASRLFAIQSGIALEVGEALKAELSPSERQYLARVPTNNLDALDAYYKGRQLVESRDAEEISRSIELYRYATELDPEFALAWVALADAYRLLSNYGPMPGQEADDLGRAAVDRALAIDDQLGQAYVSLGNLHANRLDFEAAESAYRRGIELAPNYAPAYQWYGEFLAHFAVRPDEAIRLTMTAVALDPMSAIINVDHAEALNSAARFDDALGQYDAALGIDPRFATAMVGKAVVLHRWLGRSAEAVPLYKKALQLGPSSPQNHTGLAYVYLDLEEPESARTLIAQAQTLAPDSAWTHQGVFLLHLSLNDTDTARRSAEALLAQWPGYHRPLRFLRDHHVTGGDVDAALALYQSDYPSLLGEDEFTIDGRNVEAAVDLAWLLLHLGRQQRANELLAKCLTAVGDDRRISLVAYGLTEVKAHALLGNKRVALEVLQAAVQDGWRDRWWFDLHHDRAMDTLRDEPLFHEIDSLFRSHAETQRRKLANTKSGDVRFD